MGNVILFPLSRRPRHEHEQPEPPQETQKEPEPMAKINTTVSVIKDEAAGEWVGTIVVHVAPVVFKRRSASKRLLDTWISSVMKELEATGRIPLHLVRKWAERKR